MERKQIGQAIFDADGFDIAHIRSEWQIYLLLCFAVFVVTAAVDGNAAATAKKVLAIGKLFDVANHYSRIEAATVEITENTRHSARFPTAL